MGLGIGFKHKVKPFGSMCLPKILQKMLTLSTANKINQ